MRTTIMTTLVGLLFLGAVYGEEQKQDEQIANKIVDKLGDAYTSDLKPMLAEATKQYAEREAYLASVCFTAATVLSCCFVLLLGLFVLFLRYPTLISNDDDVQLPITILSAVLATGCLLALIICVCTGVEKSANAKSPMVGLAKMVVGK